eukprot:UN06839
MPVDALWEGNNCWYQARIIDIKLNSGENEDEWMVLVQYDSDNEQFWQNISTIKKQVVDVEEDDNRSNEIMIPEMARINGERKKEEKNGKTQK